MQLFDAPEDVYRAYRKCLKKGEYKRAYRHLEKLLREFPNNELFLEEMSELCFDRWGNPERGKPWLTRLARVRSWWQDYLFLSYVEADLGNPARARKHFETAKELLEKEPGPASSKKGSRKMLSELNRFLEQRTNLAEMLKTLVGKPPNATERSVKAPVEGRSPAAGAPRLPEKKKTKPVRPPADEGKPGPQSESDPPSSAIPTYSVPIRIEPLRTDHPLLTGSSVSALEESRLLIDYAHLAVQGSFDELLCLGAVRDVEQYWYQVETVKKVLKHFRGRVLLGDEVGLGKTIEAGLLIKEYLMRGMIKNVLVLTPSPLVSQWKEEMEAKFGLEFLTTEDAEFVKDPKSFWGQKLVIASLGAAKSGKNMPLVTERFYDLVVVDEAHHLRNRATLAWKLVNQIQKRFIFLLTATPVQNNLIELFNLVTLLKPGQFRTEKRFKEEYLKKGNLRATADKDKLRGLLREVMIRNTRSAIDLKLPKRFATTLRLDPPDAEKRIYAAIDQYLRERDLGKLRTSLLLRETGSSPYALRPGLLNLIDEDGVKDIIAAIDGLKDTCKGQALLEILTKNPQEKKIIFTQFLKSMDYLSGLLAGHGIPHVTFRGDMSSGEKNASIAKFRQETPVLISSESGGEGRNLQFCNTIINFDLPWNPMRIEQRIGRLHRIGQPREVFIFNLSTKETIEDHIIGILEGKINMFEMVIGEIEPILGHLGEDREFEDLIMEIWLRNSDRQAIEQSFDQLGQAMVLAKQEYLQTKALDQEIFGEDYEI